MPKVWHFAVWGVGSWAPTGRAGVTFSPCTSGVIGRAEGLNVIQNIDQGLGRHFAPIFTGRNMFQSFWQTGPYCQSSQCGLAPNQNALSHFERSN